MAKKKAFTMIGICPNPECRKEHDVTYLEFDKSYQCSCGAYVISPSGRMILKIHDINIYPNRTKKLKEKKEDKL